jgi:hypothetical protein
LFGKKLTVFQKQPENRLGLCDSQNYRDQEKELPRGELPCPLSIVHFSLNAARKPLACKGQWTSDKGQGHICTARQKTFFLTSIKVKLVAAKPSWLGAAKTKFLRRFQPDCTKKLRA